MSDEAPFPAFPSEPPVGEEPATTSMFRTPAMPESEPRDPNAVTLRMPPAAPPAPNVAATPPPSPTVPTAPAAWNTTSVPAAPASTWSSPAPVAAPSMPPNAGAPTLTAPLVAAPPAVIPPASPSRAPSSGKSFGKWLLFGLLGLALLAGGFFVGNALRSDDTSTDTTQTATEADVANGTEDVEVSAAADPSADTATSTSSTPLVIENTGEEPIVAVAAALSPSVVSIADNFGGFGSGIIYDRDGNIVTNAHVVGTASEVTVVLSTGEQIEGTVVGVDEESDVAVVHVDRTDLQPATFADSNNVKVGQMAVAIGSPFGLTQTVTAGIVSASSRPVDSQQNEGLNTVVPMVQTDAPINPGNSGGALADRNGHVIGMNTLIRTATANPLDAGNIGVGFAIPTNIFQLLADGIIAGTPVAPSVLGVTGDDPGIGDQPGAVIVSVTENSAAYFGGLQPEDLVVSFGGVSLSSMGDLAAVVRLSPAGTPIEVQVIRDGVPVQIFVELQSR